MAEVVYFVDGDQGIIREMMFADFEALIDGLMAMPEFASSAQRAVYVQINSKLCIVSCVLFDISFDQEGHAPAQWNLPVDQLCGSAGKGPDMGAGPIKLSTSVQCSVPWHQSKLWDPQEMPDLFLWLKDAAAENLMGIDFGSAGDEDLDEHQMYEDGEYFEQSEGEGGCIIELSESPFMNGGDAPPPYPSPQGGHDMYRGYPPPPHMMPPMPYGYDPSQVPPGYYPPHMMPQHHPMGQHHPLHPGVHPTHQHGGHPSDSFSQMQAQIDKKEQQYQHKLKQLAHKQKQEMQQSKSRFEARLVSVTKEYEHTMQEVSGELNRLRTKVENLLSQKDSLENICSAQKSQLKALGDKLEDFRKRAEERQRQNTETLTRKYEQGFERQKKEMQQNFEAQLRDKDAEIGYRQEVVKQLRKDITNMRRDKIRVLNSGGDKFLEDLNDLGVSFIAFHAGAGHISIPLADMSTYMDNPLAYAAKRCLVSEELYRAWLAHYENPVCTFGLDKDTGGGCGCTVKKVDVPNEFKEGVSDRCDMHQSLTSDWENVVNIKS